MTDDAKQETAYLRDGQSIVVVVPVSLKKREGRKRIVARRAPLQEDQSAACRAEATNPSLCLALARAHRWREMLEGDDARSVADLAQALGVDGAYIRRLLRLTLLAPEIIEAILAGNEPPGLSLERLRSFPLAWAEQKTAFSSGDGRMESGNDALPGD